MCLLDSACACIIFSELKAVKASPLLLMPRNEIKGPGLPLHFISSAVSKDLAGQCLLIEQAEGLHRTPELCSQPAASPSAVRTRAALHVKSSWGESDRWPQRVVI